MYNKLMKYCFILFLTFVMLQSCYTIIDQRKIDEISERSRIGFPEGALLDSELTGRWREVFSGRVIIDGGERGREITFFSRGNLSYIPNTKIFGGRIDYGEYRVISDTLLLNFETQHFGEKLIYRISNDTLYLKCFRLKDYYTRFVFECSDRHDVWIRVK